jgi:hypothetical protein
MVARFEIRSFLAAIGFEEQTKTVIIFGSDIFEPALALSKKSRSH